MNRQKEKQIKRLTDNLVYVIRLENVLINRYHLQAEGVDAMQVLKGCIIEDIEKTLASRTERNEK